MRLLLHSYHRRSKADFRATPFARELARRGHEVSLMCIANEGRVGMREYVEDGVRFLEAPDLFTGKLRSSWDPWDAANRTACLLGRRFDLVHLFETRPAVIHPTQLYLMRHPAALVTDWSDWWGRGGLIEHQRPRWYRALFGGFETFYEERFRLGAHGTTVISHALKERAAALGVPEASISWIPNGVEMPSDDCPPPRRHRERFGLPANAFVICDSAHDVTMGIELTFRALAQLRSEGHQVMFMMTGRRQAELEAMAARLGVHEHFRHFGFVPQGSLADVLSCADAFVIPYADNIGNRGRWPGRVGNYLPLGRPIISNPTGEMVGLVEGYDVGRLVAETPQAIAEAVLHYARHPDLARAAGERARAAARGPLSWGSMTDRLEGAYGAALARASRGFGVPSVAAGG